MSRPWDADPFFKNLLQVFVFHNTSVCQMAEHCLVFRDLFREELTRCAGHPALASAPRLVSLSAKKHRLEKCSTPIGRCVLWTPALVSASVRMVLEGVGTEANQKNARDYLQALSEECLLQLSMLADAGDDGLEFLRYFDTEAFDVSRLPLEIENLRSKLDVLYIQGQVELQGFTRFMLEFLKESIALPSSVLGQHKTLGGGGGRCHLA